MLLLHHLGDDNDKSLERPDKIAVEEADLGCPPNADKREGSEAKYACGGAKNGLMHLTASSV